MAKPHLAAATPAEPPATSTGRGQVERSTTHDKTSAPSTMATDQQQPESSTGGLTQTSAATPGSSNEEKVDRPFRFLELPAELRNRVYSQAVQHPTGAVRSLRTFPEPAITLVSKRVRAEAMASLFSDCEWFLDIGANVVLRPSDVRPSAHKSAGTLGIKNNVIDLLRSSGDNVVLRNFTLRIYSVEYAHQVRRYHSERTQEDPHSIKRVATVKVIARPSDARPDAKVACTAEEGTPGDFIRPSIKYLDAYGADLTWVNEEMQILQKGMDGAVATANVIGERDGFKEFTITDIDKLVKHFRFDIRPAN